MKLTPRRWRKRPAGDLVPVLTDEPQITGAEVAEFAKGLGIEVTEWQERVLDQAFVIPAKLPGLPRDEHGRFRKRQP